MPDLPTTIDSIELQTHLEGAALRMSQIQRFGDGSGYACVVTVRSGGFGCERPFCFDDWHLGNAIAAFQSMAAGTPGEAVIRGQWEPDFIRFKMNDLGHVVVSGELFEHAELTQSLKFAFRTDQTVLGPLIRDLSLVRKG
jgi:hypothetical protein